MIIQLNYQCGHTEIATFQYHQAAMGQDRAVPDLPSPDIQPAGPVRTERRRV